MDKRKRQGERNWYSLFLQEKHCQVWMRGKLQEPPWIHLVTPVYAVFFSFYVTQHQEPPAGAGLPGLERSGEGRRAGWDEAGCCQHPTVPVMGVTDSCTVVEVCSHHCALLHSPEMPSQPPQDKGTACEPCPAPLMSPQEQISAIPFLHPA